METLPFIIGIIGNIISVLMFLAPVGTFRRIVQNKSTEDFDSLPYICTLLNSSLWTYYGIIKPGSYLVSTVNGFGVIVETIYIALFLKFADQKMRVKKYRHPSWDSECGDFSNNSIIGAVHFIWRDED
uniref:Uncharacterized protein n=1 Tax=Solanum lycopersicum TaxID=4081 RepID=A0A3Q7ENE4_SOLLC